LTAFGGVTVICITLLPHYCAVYLTNTRCHMAASMRMTCTANPLHRPGGGDI
jgi:hypothetical protein